jgi:Haloacid dehalogenase-like hydrolase
MWERHSVQAIIFDLDGTLIDSAEDLRSALNTTLNTAGLRSIEDDEIRGMIGDGMTKLLERALVAVGAAEPKQTNALAARFLEIYEANSLVSTRCYPGVIDEQALPIGSCDQQADCCNQQNSPWSFFEPPVFGRARRRQSAAAKT